MEYELRQKLASNSRLLHTKNSRIYYSNSRLLHIQISRFYRKFAIFIFQNSRFGCEFAIIAIREFTILQVQLAIIVNIDTR